MEPPDWTDLLTSEFTNLYSEGFQTVAEPTERYNCMGYAADDTSRWWWPGRNQLLATMGHPAGRHRKLHGSVHRINQGFSSAFLGIPSPAAPAELTGAYSSSGRGIR